MGASINIGGKDYKATEFYVTGPLKMRGNTWYGWCFYGDCISVERGNMFNSHDDALADAKAHGIYEDGEPSPTYRNIPVYKGKS